MFPCSVQEHVQLATECRSLTLRSCTRHLVNWVFGQDCSYFHSGGDNCHQPAISIPGVCITESRRKRSQLPRRFLLAQFPLLITEAQLPVLSIDLTGTAVPPPIHPLTHPPICFLLLTELHLATSPSNLCLAVARLAAASRLPVFSLLFGFSLFTFLPTSLRV